MFGLTTEPQCVDTDPEVRRAKEAMDQAHQKLDAAWGHVQQGVNDHDQLAELQGRHDVRLASEDLGRAKVAYEQARAEAECKLRPSFVERYRKVLAQADAHLREAQQAMTEAEAIITEARVAGVPLSPCPFAPVLPEMATEASPLEAWRRTARTMDYLD